MNIFEVKADPALLERAVRERSAEGEGGVRPFVHELAERGNVRPEEWAVPMNRAERELLLPKVELEVFVQNMEHCVNNCGRPQPGTYDWALLNEIVPQAAQRLRRLEMFRLKNGELLARGEQTMGRAKQELRRLTSILGDVLGWARSRSPDPSGPWQDKFVDGYGKAQRAVEEMLVCEEVDRAREAALQSAESSLTPKLEELLGLVKRIETRLEEARTVEPVDTINRHAVTSCENESEETVVVMQNPPGKVLTRDEAIGLAAWLVQGAEFAGEERAEDKFRATLEALRSV